MNNFNIENRRKELNLTLEQVGKFVGVSKSTVKKWESGYIDNMKRDKIALLAEILQVSPLSIIGIESPCEDYFEPHITGDFTTFPVIGEIAAGYDKICLEDWCGETIDIPNSYLRGNKKTDFFVLCVKGDSMFPTYQDGDRVLILKQSTLNYSGQIGAVIYGDEYATLKKVEYKQGEDWMRLVPVNPLYKPIYITDEELEHCRILGIPRLLIRQIEN